MDASYISSVQQFKSFSYLVLKSFVCDHFLLLTVAAAAAAFRSDSFQHVRKQGPISVCITVSTTIQTKNRMMDSITGRTAVAINALHHSVFFAFRHPFPNPFRMAESGTEAQ